MRSILQLGIVAFVALGTGTAFATNGGSALAQCQNAKLRASAAYYSCLLRVEARNNIYPLRRLKAKAVAACDAEYEWRFRQAESASGGSCSPPDPDAAIAVLKAHAVGATGTCTNVSSPCSTLSTFTEGSETRLICVLSSSTCGVDLSDVLAQASAKYPGFSITDSTTLWLQAWSPFGADGNGQLGGGGGYGGYAQTVTTLADFKAAHDNATQLYYYLGEGGGHASDSGGQGASSTLVTLTDLTLDPTTDPTVDEVYLLAGGAGGGGGDNAGAFCTGAVGREGGNGGIAIATTTAIGSGNGQGGSDGGGQGASAGVATGGGSTNGFGGMGGENGKSSLGRTGWSNTGTTLLSFSSGAGGNGGDSDCSCASGGGGGGGGWGGGGGGSHACDSTSHGGGGAASYAAMATKADNCAPQPSTSTTPPSTSFFTLDAVFQITIDLTPNVCG